MTDSAHRSWVRPLRDLAALTLVAILLVLLGRVVMPWEKMFPDFICYWTSGKLLASGQSPYDAQLQARAAGVRLGQRHHRGWHLRLPPYYYPPWFGLLWILSVPLGYSSARMAWFFLNVEFALVAGYLCGSS
jgi:hypothetical protein